MATGWVVLSGARIGEGESVGRREMLEEVRPLRRHWCLGKRLGGCACAGGARGPCEGGA
jgi:hypothetical protein